MQSFKDENLEYYKKVISDLNKRGAKNNRILTVVKYVFQKQLDFHLEKWSVTEKIHAGMVLVDLFRESTGLIEYDYNYINGKTVKTVVPTEHLLQLIDNLNDKLEIMHPQLLPMVVQPKPWTGMYNGGYLSPYMRRNRMIKSYDRNYLTMLEEQKMPMVYNALNIAQSTSWQVYQKVLMVVKALWEEGQEIAGLPKRDDYILPEFPFPNLSKEDERTEEQTIIIKGWKRTCYEIHKKNIAKRSLRMQTSEIIRIAEQFSDYESIYFPYTLDSRGRMYCLPPLFNPQGNDLAKGLLCFSKGKTVKDDKNAIKWLTIHGANMYGFDKVGYEERIQWVKDREDMICSIAENPLKNREWTEADKPFQFLAWSFEYAEFLKNPDTFKTHIPIQLDGTCNGLQHYSALLKDEIGGAAVNLTDTILPSDIYNMVAEKLKSRLNAIKNTEPLAAKWLELGFDRKLCKKNVMTLPYGESEYGNRAFISEYLQENYSLEYLWKFFKVGKNPNDCLFKVSLFLSKHLWLAIEDMLKSAIIGMEYLKKITSIANKYSSYMEWTTPAGLIVRQNYQAQRKKIIRTELYGSILKSTVNIDNGKLDKRKQLSSIAPNFIHSLDAACLMIYLNKCNEAGIDSFMIVHDCVGTYATDTELSAQLIREAFVEIYRQPVLQNFLNDIKKVLPQEVELPSLPKFGKLNIENVLDSKFFFS